MDPTCRVTTSEGIVCRAPATHVVRHTTSTGKRSYIPCCEEHRKAAFRQCPTDPGPIEPGGRCPRTLTWRLDEVPADVLAELRRAG